MNFLSFEDRGDHIHAVAPAATEIDDAVSCRNEAGRDHQRLRRGRRARNRYFAGLRARAKPPSKIEIELNQADNNCNWSVRFGERIADQLAWDEMLGLAISLLSKISAGGGYRYPGEQWLMTPAENAARQARHQETLAELRRKSGPRPIEEWHEDMGPMLWWKFPIEEPPHAGTPHDSDWPEDFYTHFTPIPVPEDPSEASNVDA